MEVGVEIDNLNVKEVPSAQASNPWLSSYGTYDAGGELMHLSWSKMKHVFSVRRRHDSLGTDIAESKSFGESSEPSRTPMVFTTAPEIKSDILWRHPVDLFVVECCSRNKPPPPHQPERWELAVSKARRNLRPKVILESWNVKCNTWAHGPTEKGSITRWSDLGYTTRIKFVRCVDVGGAVDQFRLLVARVISTDIDKWT